jgi:Skp family chaperone for outer membrane proteins
VIDSDPRLKKMATELDAMHRERDALSHKYDDIKKKKNSANGEKREYRPTIR